MSFPKLKITAKGLFTVFVSALPFWPAQAQTVSVRESFLERVDEKNLVVLTGNVNPFARPEFERDSIADAQPLRRLLLLLHRSRDQQRALQIVLDEQQDKSSPNYHDWLTPEQFGEQFGASDADIQTIISWLASRGFTGIKPSVGRAVIEFSGTAGEVRNAFHTEIHHYVVNGE